MAMSGNSRERERERWRWWARRGRDTTTPPISGNSQGDAWVCGVQKGVMSEDGRSWRNISSGKAGKEYEAHRETSLRACVMPCDVLPLKLVSNLLPPLLQSAGARHMHGERERGR